ncbi:hypothetical protein B0O80DRAFT_437149, partial [Mortierella sp. GBAus27b]
MVYLALALAAELTDYCVLQLIGGVVVMLSSIAQRMNALELMHSCMQPSVLLYSSTVTPQCSLAYTTCCGASLSRSLTHSLAFASSLDLGAALLFSL